MERVQKRKADDDPAVLVSSLSTVHHAVSRPPKVKEEDEEEGDPITEGLTEQQGIEVLAQWVSTSDVFLQG